jgi:hypothetical protein
MRAPGISTVFSIGEENNSHEHNVDFKVRCARTGLIALEQAEISLKF